MKIRPYCFLLPALLAGAAGAEEQRPVLAVFDMESKGSGLEAEDLENLSTLLRARLAECGFRVVPPQQIRERLRNEQVESYRACYDESCQIELGRELAASAIVTSQVLRLGERCQLTAMLYDLAKAAAGKAAVAEAPCTTAELTPAVGQVAEALCADLPAVSRARATSLTVQSDPDGARVFLDGQETGRAPLTVNVTPGRHRLQATLAGCEPATPQEVEVAGGQNTVVRLRLLRRANLNPWGHGAFWPGVALVTFGIFCNVQAREAAKSYHDGDVSKAEESRRFMGGAWASYITGGLLTLAGAGLWIWQAVRAGEEPALLPAAAPAPGGAALVLQGRW